MFTHPWPDAMGAALLQNIADLRAALGILEDNRRTLSGESGDSLGKPRRRPLLASDVLKANEASLDAMDLAVERVGRAVSAWIEAYAMLAPDPSKDEALVRASAWLIESYGPAISQDSPDSGTVQEVASQASWMRYSGAMSLLSRWRIRRAGAVQAIES